MNLPARLADPSASELEAEATTEDAPWRLPFLVAVAIPGASLLAILLYAWGDWEILAVATLVAGGAFVAGGLLGFLFGIPRSLAGPEGTKDAAQAGAYRPNTNLEQISDWLTKILVGVGLVQFTTLARHAGDLVAFLGPPLGGDPLGESFAGATLVIFSISGFLAFYLVTRIYLPRAFAHADRSATERKVRKNLATKNLLSAARDASTRVGGVRVDPKDIAAVVDRASELTELGTPHILWVDDRPQGNIREINAMQSLGMQVMTCLSTAEALTRLEQSSFDVVITDMGRPGNTQAGYELLDKMREAGNDTAVIIYSSSNKLEHRQLARDHGAFGSTNRPDELLDLVIRATQAAK